MYSVKGRARNIRVGKKPNLSPKRKRSMDGYIDRSNLYTHGKSHRSTVTGETKWEKHLEKYTHTDNLEGDKEK